MTDIKVHVFDAEHHDDNWPPSGLMEFSQWLQEQIAKIPEEFRETAAIEVDSVDGYEGSHYASISIVYWRPMTDDERAERARKEEEWRKQEEQRAREMYDHLRQRFGD